MVAVVVAWAATCLVGPAQAAPDPERHRSVPTGWQWWKNRTASQLRAHEGTKFRVIDLEVDSGAPHRFSATLVRNAGGHARDGSWFYARTPSGADSASKGQGRRLIDIEVYRRFGKLRFAGVTVPNQGDSGKFWDWGHGHTAEQVGQRVAQYKLRLIDIEAYETSAGRRYAWVGISNHAEDARAWWWYLNQTAASVQKRAVEHGARIVDLERRGDRWNVILLRNDEAVHSRHVLRVKPGRLARLVASNGLRITDLERHGDRFSAVAIDNVAPESGRIRDVVNDGIYGRGFFGAFSKRVGGKTYVGLAHRTRYQPMSVQKLLPLLYAMDAWDRGEVSLSDTLFWTFPKNNVKEPACPGHDGPTQTTATTLGLTLRRAMWESLNLAHEELLLEYGPDTIAARARALGLKATRLYYGCHHPGQKNWLANRSTLADMGKLFEGVDLGTFFPNQGQVVRDKFYELVADPSSGPFRTIVAEEAAKQGKGSVLDAFMARVRSDGKGGSADFPEGDHWRVGRALSWRTVLPFQTQADGGGGATIVVNTPFVGGFFVNDLRGVCHEASARKDLTAVSQQCRDYVNAMANAFATTYAEVMRAPIREALATWPVDEPERTPTPEREPSQAPETPSREPSQPERPSGRTD